MRAACLIMTLLLACGCQTIGTSGPSDEDLIPDAPDSLRLALADSQERSDLSGPDLTGVNKQEAIDQRYRRQVDPERPQFVPETRLGLDLTILDETIDGWFALYEGACDGLSDVCQYLSELYTSDGDRVWSVDPSRYFESESYLEIQDARLIDQDLYVNDACATYSEEAGQRCSSLMRIDPVNNEVLWRTRDLVSNNIFIPLDGYIVSGYGFTAEDDFLFLIDRETGDIEQRISLDSAHEYLEVQDDQLFVLTYRSFYVFDIVRH